MISTKTKILMVIIILLAAVLVATATATATAQDDPAAWPKYGDINADSALDALDLAAEIGWMRTDSAAPAIADLNADSRVDIFDLLEMLLHMRWLGGDSDSRFRAEVTVNQNEFDEPYLFIYRAYEWYYEFPRGIYVGPMSGQYYVYANREVDKVEFVLAGDTLRELSGVTPVLAIKDTSGHGDTIIKMSYTEYVISEEKDWWLKVWDKDGEMYADSGRTRFAFDSWYGVGGGGSPNIGLPLEFPMVLRGPWQRFEMEMPFWGRYYGVLKIDLNVEGADSVVFENIDQLSEAIMDQVVLNLDPWREAPDALDPPNVPVVSGAISRHTEIKYDRLLFDFYVHPGGSFVPLSPLDGNERLLSALGFPRWRREAGTPDRIYNNNYKRDPVMYEKYKDQFN